MKGTIKLFALGAMLAVFAVPALAQNDQCTDDNKDLWYAKTFLPNFKGDTPQQKIAYDAAVKYINACGPDDQYAKYMKRVLVDPINHNNETADIAKQFDTAVKENRYADQMRLGKQLLATDPDNPDVNVILGIAGLGDAGLLNESVTYAQKSISLIESGKTLKVYTKDQALGYLNGTIAKATAKTSPTDAIPMFIKAAKYDSPLKKDARIYNELAAAYAEQVDKLTKDYSPFIGKPETTESKLVLANLNQAMDAQIDALARAAALADAANKPALMERLTDVYKDRYKSTNGLNELVAGILSKPLPDQPKPITELPATASSSNTTANSGISGPSGNPGTNNGGKAVGNNLTTSTTGKNGTGAANGTGSAKPTASPTPQAKKPR